MIHSFHVAGDNGKTPDKMELVFMLVSTCSPLSSKLGLSRLLGGS